MVPVGLERAAARPRRYRAAEQREFAPRLMVAFRRYGLVSCAERPIGMWNGYPAWMQVAERSSVQRLRGLRQMTLVCAIRVNSAGVFVTV
jgi:hypothetical protein